MDRDIFVEFARQITEIASEIEALMDRYEIHQKVTLEFGDNGYVKMNTSDYKNNLFRIDSESDYYIETREKL